MVAYLGIGWFWRHAAGATSPKEANAVVALVGSVLDADVNPVLAKMPTRFGPDDFLTAGDRQATGTQTPYTARGRQAGVRNVIVVVMESVAAEYLWRFGAADSGGTPELDHYQQWARRFTSFYAHQPSTTHSLVSLLLGVYSPHSFRVVTREHPDIALPSLSGELKRRGYRTAFISAADNRFQNIDLFLSHQHFDLIADSRAGSCPSGPGHQDDCMVHDLLKWVDQDARAPIFALLWTDQTHWPYTAPESPVANGSADTSSVRRARYLRALRETDRAIGKLLRSLEERGLLESTLVVVSGDHGEAFGQHGNAFHRLLYEEEVRVPLLLINSRLFHGERDTVPGGLMDIAPTVLDLLGDSLPAQWQGRSLFDPERPDRVYLFGPYSGLFGLREGSRKFIYDPIGNEDQLYDLSIGPAREREPRRQSPRGGPGGTRAVGRVGAIPGALLSPPRHYPVRRTVVHYTDSNAFGGAERVMLQLLGGLDRERWRPVLLHHGKPALARLVASAGELGVELREVRRVSRPSELRNLPAFITALRAVDPAVFHAHLPAPLNGRYALLAAAMSPRPRRRGDGTSRERRCTAVSGRHNSATRRRVHRPVYRRVGRCRTEVEERPGGTG